MSLIALSRSPLSAEAVPDSTLVSRALHPSRTTRRVPAVDLETIASGLASSAHRVPLDQSDATRKYTRVLTTAAYDAWVIRWSPSAELDLHDHGGSSGVVHVVEGELVEQHADLVSGVRLQSRAVRAGEQAVIASTTVHAVANFGPAEALSVHVYSPPLSSMMFYDEREGLLTASERNLVACDSDPT